MNLYATHFLPFLQEHGPLHLPVLVACSGGPDSMALLRLMNAYRKSTGAEFGVAHIDHGWRNESADEASLLEKICEEIDAPFYIEQIDPSSISDNLENACREIRRKFLKRLCIEKGYQCVLLGHHLDDQAETVLKRLLEGARLENCGGMKEVSVYEGVPFWRPLLKVRKQQLTAWLESEGYSYFLDPTNCDDRYLRSRMRKSILPYISSQFGKEVSSGLAFLGLEARELKEFMGEHLRQWLDMQEQTPLGKLWDLSCECPGHLFEARGMISEILPGASREIVYAAAKSLVKGEGNKCFQIGTQTLYVDRKRIFLAEEMPEGLPLVPTPLKEYGTFGNWAYRVQPVTNKQLSGWKQALYGKFQLPLTTDAKPLKIVSPEVPGGYRRKMNELRRQEKVPAFIKKWVPVIIRDEEVVLDFICRKSGVQNVEGTHEIILTKAIR